MINRNIILTFISAILLISMVGAASGADATPGAVEIPVASGNSLDTAPSLNVEDGASTPSSTTLNPRAPIRKKPVPVKTPKPTTVMTAAPTVAQVTIPTTVPTTIPTTVPTTIPTTVPITIPTTVPTAVLTTVPTTTTAAPNQAEIQARVDAAYADGYARLANMQAVYQAWTIPAPSTSGAINAKNNHISNLAGDGVKDESKSLQALINGAPSGSVIYFPAATYKFTTGLVNINKPLTFVGERGTIFDCTKANLNQKAVFYLNRYGSPSSVVSGVTITGIVFEGPGANDTILTTIIDASFVTDLHIHHIKIANVGYMAIAVTDCTDTLIEDSVFDNIWQGADGLGWGYGVCIMDRSDRITVRDNFFVTKGRHGVDTGTMDSKLQPEDYVREILVENNYFEYMSRPAVNAHVCTIGPYRTIGNVFYKCNGAVLHENGQAEVINNVIIDCVHGVNLGTSVCHGQIPSYSGKDVIKQNTMINIYYEGVRTDRSNFIIQDNIIRGWYASAPGMTFDSTIDSSNPRTSCIIGGNVLNNVIVGIESESLAGISKVSNYQKINGSYQMC